MLLAMLMTTLENVLGLTIPIAPAPLQTMMAAVLIDTHDTDDGHSVAATFIVSIITIITLVLVALVMSRFP